MGIEFENGLMDEYRHCHNKCIFCFIDQMPKGMRDTLYFKDDDSRLSFLQGNYVTLTNMSDHDIDRICRYHLSPINISFQTMNPELRCKMLNNRFAGDALKKVDILNAAGIRMNGQIVLCKGVNDGKELEYSIRKLMEYLPNVESVSVVPVGLSRYREGLYPLEPFNAQDAGEIIEDVYKRQGGLILNDDIKQVTVDDEPVKMTPIEYNILLLLMKNQGRVFSINQIYESIWNEDAIGADNTCLLYTSRCV